MASPPAPFPSVTRRASQFRTTLLYLRAMVFEFRWTLTTTLVAMAIGTVVHRVTPAAHGGARDLLHAMYYTWMALFAQPVNDPDVWWLVAIYAIYPLLGFVLIGEGIVRLGLLMASRREGEKEWMRVMASTCDDHVVLCGLGHLGFRVLEQLTANNISVVALEKDPNGRFVAQAKGMHIPVLLRDMKDDTALLEAGVQRARAIIIASNDDMANLEVALDARRLNPKIKVIMRLFDQQIASKISGALLLDAAFSSSALAAPVVAAMAIDSHVMASYLIAGVPHVTFEFHAGPGAPIIGQTLGRLEATFNARVLSQTRRNGPTASPPTLDDTIQSGDVLVVHVAAARMAEMAALQGQHDSVVRR